MSRVFMPQRPVVRVDGQWKDKYDLSSARLFGQPVDLLPIGETPSSLVTMQSMMLKGLGDFRQTVDYLMAVGDPVAIALAVLSLPRGTTEVQLLKWNRHVERYVPYGVSVVR